MKPKNYILWGPCMGRADRKAGTEVKTFLNMQIYKNKTNDQIEIIGDRVVLKGRFWFI